MIELLSTRNKAAKELFRTSLERKITQTFGLHRNTERKLLYKATGSPTPMMVIRKKEAAQT